MMRAEQVLFRTEERPLRTRVTDAALGRTDLTGRVGSALAPLANAALDTPGSAPRRAMQAAAGISAQRVLPPYAASGSPPGSDAAPPSRPRPPPMAAASPCSRPAWSNTRTPPPARTWLACTNETASPVTFPKGSGAAALRCCTRVTSRASPRRPVTTSRSSRSWIRTRRGHGQEAAVVVPQPTCGYSLKNDYRDYVGGPDADLVAEHTYDAAEYLMKVHRDDKAEGGDGLDVDFTGDVPETTTYHAPCHLRAQNIGLKSRDLLKLTGTKHHARGRVLRDRRHLGASRREPRDEPEGRLPDGRCDRQGRQRGRGGRLLARQRRDPVGDRCRAGAPAERDGKGVRTPTAGPRGVKAATMEGSTDEGSTDDG